MPSRTWTSPPATRCWTCSRTLRQRRRRPWLGQRGGGGGGGGGLRGALVRAVAPLPRKGEALEPSVARAKAPLKHVGADGLLEDGRAGGGAGGEEEGGGGKGAGQHQALSEALVLAHQPEAKGLGQADRKRAPTAAVEFFKKLGGGFSEHITSVPDRGAFASFTAAEPAPASSSSSSSSSSSVSASHDSAMQEDAGVGGEAAAAAAAAAAAGGQRTRGLGRIYLEFSTIEAAVAAACALSGRFFSGHILVVSFESEAAFCSGALVSLSEAPCLPPGGAGEGAMERGALVLAGEPIGGGGGAGAGAGAAEPAMALSAAAAEAAALAGGGVD
jgi:hypothetical protein